MNVYEYVYVFFKMYKYMYIFSVILKVVWVRQRVSGLERWWTLPEKGKRWWRLVAILTFTSFVMLGEKGDRPTEQSSRLFPWGQLKLNSFIRESEWLEELETCCSRLFLKTWKWERSKGFFGELLKHVITVLGQILVSRTDDDTLPSVCGF